jgi:molecular chaperone DnaK
MAVIVGIDLGTTKSAIAVWRDGAPQIIPDTKGRKIIPSMVALDPENGQLVAGYPAQEIATTHPHFAISSIKRLMGRRFDEDAVRTALEKLHLFYEVEASHRHQGAIEAVVSEMHLLPQQVSAKILQQLKATAEGDLGFEISQAVITVPAYFHDSQRQATRDAGRLAGLEVPRVLNEPTAACLAFSHNKRDDSRRTIAVYDLGGGTFDISILDAGGRKPFRVRATNGDTLLGGDDLDLLIVDWILSEIGGQEAQRLSEDIPAQAMLRAAAKAAKTELSSAETARVQVPGRLSAKSGVKDLDLELTRDRLKTLSEPFIEKTLEPCRKALEDAGLEAADIEEVLLVGGQTRMPAVRHRVRDFFGREPNTSVPPEEVVALGAAVQGAMLAGEATGLKLADVVPLTLGVRKKGGLMHPLIKRNTPVPVTVTEVFSTTADKQESAEVQIWQGERPLAEKNVNLGSFILAGIELAPVGQPKIEVTFHVDADGILHVTGKDVRTGVYDQMTITDSMRLTDEEIDAMVREAVEHAEEYEAQRLRVEQEVQVTSLADNLTSLLEKRKAKLPSELVASIKEALVVPVGGDLTTRLAALEELWRLANVTSEQPG